jgi:two-component system cell cycle response regulator
MTLSLFDFWRKRSSPPLPEGKTVSSSGGGRREVLICTRNAELGNDLCDLLSERGYTPSVHRNPWAARYAARRQVPDLAIIDWHLGQQSAAKLASTLYDSNGSGACSILALVPQGQSDTLVKILELGVNDFVMLPLDRTLLATRLSLIEIRLQELAEMRALQNEIKQE